MAIVQISQIQIRRGLQQDLPQLASAEMGWSLDTRRLFIGNGTTEEGAPSTGITEILTQYSNFLGFVNSYTFAGTDSGYTSQTGASQLTPTTRSIQSVLDEHVSVRDFGAKGDGVTDDTAAINAAAAAACAALLLSGALLFSRKPSGARPDLAKAFVSTENAIARLPVPPLEPIPEWMSPTAAMLDPEGLRPLNF